MKITLLTLFTLCFLSSAFSAVAGLNIISGDKIMVNGAEVKTLPCVLKTGDIVAAKECVIQKFTSFSSYYALVDGSVRVGSDVESLNGKSHWTAELLAGTLAANQSPKESTLLYDRLGLFDSISLASFTELKPLELHIADSLGNTYSVTRFVEGAYVATKAKNSHQIVYFNGSGDISTAFGNLYPNEPRVYSVSANRVSGTELEEGYNEVLFNQISQLWAHLNIAPPTLLSADVKVKSISTGGQLTINGQSGKVGDLIKAGYYVTLKSGVFSIAGLDTGASFTTEFKTKVEFTYDGAVQESLAYPTDISACGKIPVPATQSVKVFGFSIVSDDSEFDIKETRVSSVNRVKRVRRKTSSSIIDLYGVGTDYYVQVLSDRIATNVTAGKVAMTRTSSEGTEFGLICSYLSVPHEGPIVWPDN